MEMLRGIDTHYLFRILIPITPPPTEVQSDQSNKYILKSNGSFPYVFTNMIRKKKSFSITMNTTEV